MNRKPNTVKSHREALRQIAKTFDGKRLSQITTAELERYKESRVGPDGKKGKVSANGELAVLCPMMNRCRKLGGLFTGENPVREVQRFKEPIRKTRFLEWEEEARLPTVVDELSARSSSLASLRTTMLCGVDAGTSGSR